MCVYSLCKNLNKDPKLTDHERGQIEAFYSTDMSNRTIAIMLVRSKITQHLFNSKTIMVKQIQGGPKLLSLHDEKRVCRLVYLLESTPENVLKKGLNVCHKSIPCQNDLMAIFHGKKTAI